MVITITQQHFPYFHVDLKILFNIFFVILRVVLKYLQLSQVAFASNASYGQVRVVIITMQRIQKSKHFISIQVFLRLVILFSKSMKLDSKDICQIWRKTYGIYWISGQYFFQTLIWKLFFYCLKHIRKYPNIYLYYST